MHYSIAGKLNHVFLYFYYYKKMRKNENGFTFSFTGKSEIEFHRFHLPTCDFSSNLLRRKNFPLTEKRGSPRSLVMGLLLDSGERGLAPRTAMPVRKVWTRSCKHPTLKQTNKQANTHNPGDNVRLPATYKQQWNFKMWHFLCPESGGKNLTHVIVS